MVFFVKLFFPGHKTLFSTKKDIHFLFFAARFTRNNKILEIYIHVLQEYLKIWETAGTSKIKSSKNLEEECFK